MKTLSSYKQFAENTMFEADESELSDKDKEQVKNLLPLIIKWRIISVTFGSRCVIGFFICSCQRNIMTDS